jgi:hypothetical protein
VNGVFDEPRPRRYDDSEKIDIHIGRGFVEKLNLQSTFGIHGQKIFQLSFGNSFHLGEVYHLRDGELKEICQFDCQVYGGRRLIPLDL